jgi:hypothetical protein
LDSSGWGRGAPHPQQLLLLQCSLRLRLLVLRCVPVVTLLLLLLRSVASSPTSLPFSTAAACQQARLCFFFPMLQLFL